MTLNKHSYVSVCKRPSMQTGSLAVVTEHEPHPIEDLVFTSELFGMFMRVTWLSHEEADVVLDYLQLPGPWVCLTGPFNGMPCWSRPEIIEAYRNAQLRFEAAQ